MPTAKDKLNAMSIDKPIEPLALTAEEVAGLLGVSRAHVWKLHSIGHLPLPIRLGRATRWNRKTLEDWLAAGAPSRDRWEASRDVKCPGG